VQEIHFEPEHLCCYICCLMHCVWGTDGVCKTQAKSWKSDDNEEPIQGTNPKTTLLLILKIILVQNTEKNYTFSL